MSDPVRILLVDDDEDDFLLTREMIREADRLFVMEWEGRGAWLATVRDITETKACATAVETEAEQLRTSYNRLRASLKEQYRFGDIVGKSPAMQAVYETVLSASRSHARVVIEGESGTGKELVARVIHDLSDRAEKPFVPVNCGAIPEGLFESEFFGHKKGAFTGANVETHGFFGLSEGGTLFLDEVGELSLKMQVKLLRAIEGGGCVQVGGEHRPEEGCSDHRRNQPKPGPAGGGRGYEGGFFLPDPRGECPFAPFEGPAGGYPPFD